MVSGVVTAHQDVLAVIGTLVKLGAPSAAVGHRKAGPAAGKMLGDHAIPLRVVFVDVGQRTAAISAKERGGRPCFWSEASSW